MQFIDTMQPRGATRILTTAYFSPQHYENFWVKIVTHQSPFWRNGHSKIQNSHFQLCFLDKWATYLDSLEPLGLRCCFELCVRWGGVGHFSQSKNARLINSIVQILASALPKFSLIAAVVSNYAVKRVNDQMKSGATKHFRDRPQKHFLAQFF